jgi:hypothetical protein
VVADDARMRQMSEDVIAALAHGRHCLVLTQWTDHLDRPHRRLDPAGPRPTAADHGRRFRRRRATIAGLAAKRRRCTPWITD